MASINKCLRHKLNFFNNCLWIYEDEFSDDIVDSKINLAKSRHKTLVNYILSGKITYDENAYKSSKHNTVKNKDI